MICAADVDALLPQTQCRLCGYAGCAPYAAAIVEANAPINRCPPGGEAGIYALAQLLKRPPLPLDASCGDSLPHRVARIDETVCIGCAKCLAPCPTDAIVGAPRYLHGVITALCTGCGLCLPPCPVDCIRMEIDPSTPQRPDADLARQRFAQHNARLEREQNEQVARLAAAERRATSEGS